MHRALELDQRSVSADAPFPVLLADLDAECSGTFPLVTADGGLMLSNRLGHQLPCLEPDQTIETAELFDRNHRFDKFLSILGFEALARNPQ